MNCNTLIMPKGQDTVLLYSMYTVESRYNDPRYNDISSITLNMLCRGKSYSKMYGTEPRYNGFR